MEQGFIDIHSHILPAIDDGSKNWEQTERMLQMQREQGVTHVIATPHFDMEQNYQQADKIRELVAEANEHAKKAAPEITLYTGCEVLNGGQPVSTCRVLSEESVPRNRRRHRFPDTRGPDTGYRPRGALRVSDEGV